MQEVPLDSPIPANSPEQQRKKETAAAPAAPAAPAAAPAPAPAPAASPHRGTSTTGLEPGPQEAGAPAAARRQSTADPEVEPDATGLGAVQSGLWGLWSSVSNAGVVKAAVSSARTMTDKAVAHVQQRGLVQAAVDGAQAAVEGAKRMDNTYLHGTLTKIVDTTVTAAHRGMDKVAEHLPHEEAQERAISVVLTSSKFEKVNAVRVALQGRYEGDVGLRALTAESGIAPQPVGFAATRRGAFGRIESLREQSAIRPREIIISIENGLVEVFPDHWMDVAVLVLRDDENNITVETVSQAVPAPIEHVRAAMAATPADYALRETGWAVTVGHMIKKAHPNINDADWAPLVCGVSRQSQLHFALVVLLGMYTAALRSAATPPAPAAGAGEAH